MPSYIANGGVKGGKPPLETATLPCYNLNMKAKIRIPRKKIAEFSRRWKVTEFSLFGSVLREDFRPDSDVDVLVTFAPNAEISLFDLVQMKLDLEKLFHRPVDVIEKDALENPFRKREILRTAQVVYAAQ
jgi:predicted nucleotidyltransferase